MFRNLSQFRYFYDERLYFLLRKGKNNQVFIFTIQFVICYEIRRNMSVNKQIKPTEGELKFYRCFGTKEAR